MTGIKYISVVLFGMITASMSPVDKRSLIEQALDEPASITLTDVSLEDAFKEVSRQTGVDVMLSSRAQFYIPQGGATKVNATIVGKSLREGLMDLIGPLGMRFVVREDFVEVVPKDALLCLNRPATWHELNTLSKLSALKPGVIPQDLVALQGITQFNVALAEASRILTAAIQNAGAGPGDEVLTVVCDNLGWSWCLEDQRIVISAIEQQYRSMLGQSLGLKLTNRPLFDVLRLVGKEVGVPVRVEPGALQSLPLQTQRSFSVNITQQTAEEAFDTICAYTGLGYFIDAEGVLFYRPEGLTSMTPESGGEFSAVTAQLPAPKQVHDPYVAKIVVPLENDQTVEWLIRASELPADLLEQREKDIASFIEAMRKVTKGERE